jgi:hypothetical protein
MHVCVHELWDSSISGKIMKFMCINFILIFGISNRKIIRKQAVTGAYTYVLYIMLDGLIVRCLFIYSCHNIKKPFQKKIDNGCSLAFLFVL